MAKNLQFNARLAPEVMALIMAESERLTVETGKKVSQADVVSMAMVKWCSPADGVPAVRLIDFDDGDEDARREFNLKVAQTAIDAITGARASETARTLPEQPKARAESVAQRKARETKEHAAALAESDTLAKMTGRDDIEYDLENVPHRSVSAMAIESRKAAERQQYEVFGRTAKPLARPCGSTEAKRRREQ